MSPEDILPEERSQTTKATQHVGSAYIKCPDQADLYRNLQTRKQISSCLGLLDGRRAWACIGLGESFWG